VVMDGAVVGESSIVGAMAFVKAGLAVPPRSLVIGSPARVVRELSAAEVADKTRGTAMYHRLTQRSLQTMRSVDPLSRPEPGRRRFTPADVDPV